MIKIKKLSQKLSIRLLREDETPESSLRPGNAVEDWPTITGSKVLFGTLGGNSPRWTNFLQLDEAQKSDLINHTAAALLFINKDNRWFAVSFGLGHVKIDPDAVEQDFGLLVTLNTVDPENLKSADARTPDENTITRRSQTSRASNQTAFGIDIEKDIVRGVSGKPKNTDFGSKVSGSDALSIDRKALVTDLPDICSEAFIAYKSKDYQKNFSWIDKIKFVRDKPTIKILDAMLVNALDEALNVGIQDTLHLAFPVIYEPDNSKEIRYKGFDSDQNYFELDITGYINALKEKSISTYIGTYLQDHSVHEVTDDGVDIGGKWKIRDCIVYEADVSGEKYILSDSKWYKIESDLVKAVTKFFNDAPKTVLPAANLSENEAIYNERISKEKNDLLSLDRKNLKATGALSEIETCDFLSKDRKFIHIKDQSSSSRLSHLFSQGTVPARVLITDQDFRDKLIKKIQQQEAHFSKTGYSSIIPKSTNPYVSSNFTVVYGVITSSPNPKLPFFSLVTFRQAATDLKSLGYNYEFSWIQRPASKPIK